MEFSYSEFKEWVRAQDPSIDFTLPTYCTGCPVAKFAQSKGMKDAGVSIGGRGPIVSGETDMFRLPQDFAQFIYMFDTRFGHPKDRTLANAIACL